MHFISHKYKIKFKNNDIERFVYDFMIDSKKVGTICKNNVNSYSFTLTKYDCRINGEMNIYLIIIIQRRKDKDKDNIIKAYKLLN